MIFTYGKQDFASLPQAEANCWLLANGLGGFASTSAAFSVTRCDQGLLLAAQSPNRRFNLVHRLSEQLTAGDETVFLSSQRFGDETPAEDGYKRLVSFTWDGLPRWRYEAGAVRVVRTVAMERGANTTAVVYTVENGSDTPCTLRVTPVFQFAPKGEPPQCPQTVTYLSGAVRCGQWTVYLNATGRLLAVPTAYETLYYADDEKDGRTASGVGLFCCAAELTVPAGETTRLELVFSDSPNDRLAGDILRAAQVRQRALADDSGFQTPEAQELARAAGAFLADRAGCGGKTILAGFPFFGDWGRDTMIALPGCMLARGEYDAARDILRTFLAYEKDGLVPNLFPEGGTEPMYNSADAPLLLINCLWLYYQRTADDAFVREAWPVLTRIAGAYQTGTRFAIGMDEDGLIHAGEGLDQVTWMDVRVDNILPTPRHGKPVEINAYWYSALRVLARLAPIAGADGSAYDALAERVRRSFVSKFWMEDRGYLKDVLSGTKADEQLRCNQIWAVTMPFTMLSPEQERRVTDTVYRCLYTPYGLRTLSPEDPEFHPFYGGPQRQRDMAYHQGTVWPYPMGAWYLAYLKTRGNTPKAASDVRRMLGNMEELLREGCVGQLPEIYDGGQPGPSKGCFAQAWSVGELLRVYEALERIEREAGHGVP